MTEPYGEVLEHYLQWVTSPVFQFNHKTKMNEYWGEQIKHDEYVADNSFKHIKKGFCRICGKKIQNYSQKYYQAHFDNGFKFCFLYCAANFYCEDCAKAESEKRYYNSNLPRLVSVTYPMKDDELCERREYSDGSVIEDMSQREYSNQKAFYQE